MLERISNLAETMATNMARRAFFGRVGQGALTVTGLLGGFLLMPAHASAGNAFNCCVYECPPVGIGSPPTYSTICGTTSCPPSIHQGACLLVRQSVVHNCNSCRV
jgi:hypothetical protein